ncbi:integrase arm-type DNA-binding domain-containing protein [Luteimonas sp. BDR2-5]|uniref:tyrosine-type recombinase/integrase n=1 Tax=Proluteimonas luteida TaxID=2878685 RepID=UPI001E48EDB0|nr:integrase arm-type DNA-binding domain-containing protein [Luteimonas sp. BDR2-5]MCD9026649.1 integrase arm-type DNA-binding domain-containing protein [Luteimonas sp. BDR2-5]
MPLTDTAIRKTKPGPKPRKLYDAKGLYLLLRPDGSRWWRWKYRRPVTGKENTLSLGVYPDTGLADARAKRDEARKLLANGVDPGEHRRAEKAAGKERAANSFEVVAREWIAKQKSGWVESHASRIELRLKNDVFPWLGGRPVADIGARELLTTLNRVVDRGAVESAHRILQNCSQVFRYAIITARADRNPAEDLRGALPPVKPTHRAAITQPKRIGELLRAIDAYKGSLVTKCALRLAPHVFLRPGELRQAEWEEFDLDVAEWNIPPEKMKMRSAHLVPLSTQALAILREIEPLTGGGKYVFPSARTADRPMSDNAVLAALRRMGFSKDEMSGHGFRAMARTVLDEVLNVRPDYIEHQLAHAVKDPNGRAYNRTAHLHERVLMMQEWGDYLDILKAGDNVVPFRKKGDKDSSRIAIAARRRDT